ncbi:hypothetical protein NA57DRAFT_57765 [Rhizodiscina lignyota]|uniref:Uncharacterized protein n=1 Tax=Rhizodiscina lignyota TaxID=1504668 RepID=A0A9P4M4T8_9PEZI|nr:hypothetical protein NA57DRAFT_57765 [Rhizodiscina lignyota]
MEFRPHHEEAQTGRPRRQHLIWVYGLDNPMQRLQGREHLEQGRYIYDENLQPLELFNWESNMRALVPARDPYHPRYQNDHDPNTASPLVNWQVAAVDRTARNVRAAEANRGRGRGGRGRRFRQRATGAGTAGYGQGPVDWYGIMRMLTNQPALPVDGRGLTIPARAPVAPIIPAEQDLAVDPQYRFALPPPHPHQLAPDYGHQPWYGPAYIGPTNLVLPIVGHDAAGRLVAHGIATPVDMTPMQAHQAMEMHDIFTEMAANQTAYDENLAHIHAQLQRSTYRISRSTPEHEPTDFLQPWTGYHRRPAPASAPVPHVPFRPPPREETPTPEAQARARRLARLREPYEDEDELWG